MANYTVIITRDITESTVIEVQAETPEQAEDMAIEKLSNSTDAEWRIDDGSWNQGDAYVTAVDRVSEEAAR